MNHRNPIAVTAEQICFRREIAFYIRRIHLLNNGADDEWLKEYTDQVLLDWGNRLTEARDCFKELFAREKAKQ